MYDWARGVHLVGQTSRIRSTDGHMFCSCYDYHLVFGVPISNGFCVGCHMVCHWSFSTLSSSVGPGQSNKGVWPSKAI